MLKAGDHTLRLHERYISLSNSCISYWETEAQAKVGAPPRGSGRVIDTEEWWPTRKNLFTPLSEDEEYDGCRFLVRLLPSEGGRLTCYRLVAPSPSERLKWMAAIVEGTSKPSASTSPLATGEPSDARASDGSGGDGSGETEGSGAPAPPPEHDTFAEVLAPLPEPSTAFHDPPTDLPTDLPTAFQDLPSGARAAARRVGNVERGGHTSRGAARAAAGGRGVHAPAPPAPRLLAAAPGQRQLLPSRGRAAPCGLRLHGGHRAAPETPRAVE